MEKNFRNPVLESEIRNLMAKTNANHFQWTSKQDFAYLDENTLVVAFSLDRYDGTDEKRYSILYLITPAGKKELYNEQCYQESSKIERLDRLIVQILSMERREENIIINLRMANGSKQSIFA